MAVLTGGTAGANAPSGGTTSDRNLLTDKELLYVKDFLSWELLAIKKFSDVAGACQDANLRTLIDAAGKRHQQHYNTLLSHLQRHSQGGAVPS
jgi:hypothetical protein